MGSRVSASTWASLCGGVVLSWGDVGAYRRFASHTRRCGPRPLQSGHGEWAVERRDSAVRAAFGQALTSPAEARHPRLGQCVQSQWKRFGGEILTAATLD